MTAGQYTSLGTALNPGLNFNVLTVSVTGASGKRFLTISDGTTARDGQVIMIAVTTTADSVTLTISAASRCFVTGSTATFIWSSSGGTVPGADRWLMIAQQGVTFAAC
jgi:hypothetical protein